MSRKEVTLILQLQDGPREISQDIFCFDDLDDAKVEPFYKELKRTLSDGWWRNDLLERLQEQPVSRWKTCPHCGMKIPYAADASRCLHKQQKQTQGQM